MGLLTDTTIASARTQLERLHTITAQVDRLLETVASDGSVSQSWSSVGSINCRVESSMNGSQLTASGNEPASHHVYEYTVFTAHNADVRTGDRLTLSSGAVLSVEQSSRNQTDAFVSVYGCSEVAS